VEIGHNAVVDHKEAVHKEVDHMVVASMHCVVEEVAHIPHLEEIGVEDTRLADQGREKIHLEFEWRLRLMVVVIEGGL